MTFDEETPIVSIVNLSLKEALKQLPNFEPDIWSISLFSIIWRTNLIFYKLESYSTRSSHISRVLLSSCKLYIFQKKKHFRGNIEKNAVKCCNLTLVDLFSGDL